MLDDDAKLHPIVQSIVFGTPQDLKELRLSKLQRAVVSNRSQVYKELNMKSIVTRRTLSDGSDGGYRVQAVLNLRYPFTMIFKGLYYDKFKERLKDGTKFKVIRMDEPMVNNVLGSMLRYGVTDVRSIGQVCEWVLFEHEGFVFCIIAFYESIFILMRATLPTALVMDLGVPLVILFSRHYAV